MKFNKSIVIVLVLVIIINLENILILLSIDSSVALFILTAILVVLVLLLTLIILALTTEMKIFHKLYAKPYAIIKYKDIEVNYLWQLNGGGIILGYEFVHLVSQKIGKVNHVFEYCAGPGFIGFNLLANNLCDRLTLADVNPKAVEVIKETIRMNGLQDRVTVYQSDCLDSIPESEQWDLVVGNPPWDLSKNNKDIRVHDPGALVHNKFYQEIKRFLKSNGSILFVEGGEYTNVQSFKAMIESNDLRIIESIGPISFLKIFKDLKTYKGIGIPLVIFLRLGLSLREVYFILSKKT